MIEQEELSLKHIALLRKVIMEQRSGAAWFMGRDWSSTIPFDRGVLLGAETPDTLGRVLQEPVLRFKWNDSYRRDEGIAIPILPRQALSQAVADLNLPVERLIAFRKNFAKLPDVKVRYMSAFRFQTLYQMTLSTGSTCLDDFFALSPDFTELRKRLNIVIAAYCMGDLLPAIGSGGGGPPSAKPASVVAPTDTAKVVSRIMARLLRGAKE